MEHISKLIPEIKVEQAVSVQKPSATGSSLQMALKSSPLVKSDPEGLQKALRYVMMIVGLRAQNLPDDLEKAVLMNYIRANYGGHTIAEIKMAFELALKGDLDLKPDEVKCYENFSVLYFSTVMNSYRRWAAQEYKETVKEEPPHQVVLTDQQLDDIVRGDIEAFYQRCLRGVVPDVTPAYFKDILIKDGLMKEGESLPNFFVQRMGIGAKNIYTKE